MSRQFAAARALLEQGVGARAYPAAVVDVGTRTSTLWREAVGGLTFSAAAPRADTQTIFDLASLTKVIVTASAAMRAVADGALDLRTPVADLSEPWAQAPDRRRVTVRHLLDHSSGLPAHLDLWRRVEGREAYEAAIATTPLASPPGSGSTYSDLGFILLGLILERVRGATLDVQLGALVSAPPREVLTYRPDAALEPRIAPTEHDPWRGRTLVGDVHDENAAALGGVAGHAGVFGTVGAVGAFARLILRTFAAGSALGPAELMATFAARTGVPGSSRALGWDTMLPTSSCGTRMSSDAIGHTGFTGTSLWIDWRRDLYVVLLTNRVHPTRRNELFRALRPKIHDAIMSAVLE